MLNWGNSIPCHFNNEKIKKWCNEVMHHELRKGRGRTCFFQREYNSTPPPPSLLSLAGAIVLSRQNASFVATKECLSRQNYVCLFLSRQNCHDKYLSRKTRLSSRQSYASRIFVPTKLCKYNVCRGRGQVGRGQVGRGQVGRGQVGRGQVGRGQVGRGQVGRGQAGRSQVGRGQVGK